MPRAWDLNFKIEKDRKTPIFQQVAETLAHQIQEGSLPPGTLLPGSRKLALHLNLNRNTITDAYSELFSQGWIELFPGKSPCVSRMIQIEKTHKVPPSKDRPQVSKSPPVEANSSKALRIDDGYPDGRLFPIEPFSRAFGRIARRQQSSLYTRELNPQGSLRLRSHLSEMLNLRRGLSSSCQDILITRGSQQGIFLVAHLLSQRQGAIAVESPGYTAAWNAFEACGLEIKEIPIDRDGLDVEKLSLLLQKKVKISAVYVTPHHQYPTTVSLKADRRLKLLELAKRYDFWIIEDDYDHDFYYDVQPLLPLASMRGKDRVIYISSLSKLMTVGVRAGYLIAPKELLDELIKIRTFIDRMGDPILEEAIAEMIEEGELQRHINKMRLQYRKRRDFLCNSLMVRQETAALFNIPTGGMAVWLKFSKSFKYENFTQLMNQAKIRALPWNSFVKKESQAQGTRVGFASLNEAEILFVTRAISQSL